MRAELRQPRRIRDVGLSSRQILHVLGVDEHDLEGSLFEQVVEGLPVVTGRLHHNQRHPLGDEVLAQRQDLAGHRSPRRHLGVRSGSTGFLGSHGDLGVSLRDVKTRASVMDDVHDVSFPFVHF